MLTLVDSVDFKTRAPDIDSHHQSQVELLGEMQKVIDSGERPIRLISLLHKYTDLIVHQFAEEEELMLDAQYPHYLDHKLMHDQSIEIAMMQSGDELLSDSDKAKALVSGLRQWLINHIELDRQMADQLN